MWNTCGRQSKARGQVRPPDPPLAPTAPMLLLWQRQIRWPELDKPRFRYCENRNPEWGCYVWSSRLLGATWTIGHNVAFRNARSQKGNKKVTRHLCGNVQHVASCCGWSWGVHSPVCCVPIWDFKMKGWFQVEDWIYHCAHVLWLPQPSKLEDKCNSDKQRRKEKENQLQERKINKSTHHIDPPLALSDEVGVSWHLETAWREWTSRGGDVQISVRRWILWI